ncbi:MAG TPA: hypothetical protein VER58_13930 [Thermoanaerobaculia bacterium]|nr:hypothetical protein [Thermoanaerobaculia bacterium]
MKRILIAVATAGVLLTIGCNKNQTAGATSNTPDNTQAIAQQTNLSPEDLGTLGAEIKKHPKDADKLLTDKGLTEQQFVKAVRKVSESPEDSKRYAAAFKKAS